MKKIKEMENSDWKFSWMAFVVFIGGSLGSQLVYYPDVPNLPSILGWLIGSIIMVVGNAIYVLYKRKKNNGAKDEKHNHG